MNNKDIKVRVQIEEQLPCGIIIFSDDGTILRINNPLLNHLGYSPSDLQAKLEAILPIASRIFYQTHIFPLLKMQGKMEEIFFFLKAKRIKKFQFY